MAIQTTHPLSVFEGVDPYIQKLRAGEPDWLTVYRRQALGRFVEEGLPAPRDEEWRFTALEPFLRSTYRVGASSAAPKLDIGPAGYYNPADVNLVFVDGVFAPSLSSPHLHGGARLSALRPALSARPDIEQALTRYHLADSSAFIALNQALWYDGALFEVPARTVVPSLIHIIHVASSGAQRRYSAPRALIRVGELSECTVLESHLSQGEADGNFTNPLTDIWVAENATLRYIKAQGESLSALHIGTTRVWQERNSKFEGFSLSVGAALCRNELLVTLNGEGAGTVLNGLYAVNGTQHVDNHTAVDHRVPNATSNQLYKGLLNGQARAVFNGKIFVRPAAQGTSSYQLNKNLVLGKDCRVDTKPQLEIFADDVKCTHGATIGQLNEDEIFYLQTRAIARRESVRMLTHGFMNDIISTVQHPAVQEKLNLLLQPTFESL